MITNKIKESLKQAITELSIAENELRRPDEDVVTMAVCTTARESMYSLMRLFLLSNNINHTEGKSLVDLLSQCKAIDKQFGAINLSKISCNDMSHEECENKYCLSTLDVNDCISTAKQLKTLVLNKLKLNESELE
ncbi:MAG: hypothetical protein ACLQQ4_09300 [Bacteroidia bacterium]